MDAATWVFTCSSWLFMSAISCLTTFSGSSGMLQQSGPTSRAGHPTPPGKLRAMSLLLALWFALAPYVAIDIVDDPRPQLECGYAPEAMHVQAGSWVVWSNAGAD